MITPSTTVGKAPYTHVVKAKGGAVSEQITLGTPMILDSEFGVIEPAMMFLMELRLWKSMRTGSLLDVSYIICSWCNFLRTRGSCWSRPTEDLFLAWIRPVNVEHGVHRTRENRRAHVIYRWYQFMVERRYGDEAIAIFAEGIRSVERDGQKKPRFQVQRGPILKHGQRPIPDADEVAKVCNALLDGFDERVSERNWLIAVVKSRTGLRAMGLASLTTDMLDLLLSSVGIDKGADKVRYLARDSSAKTKIRRALAAEEGSGRNNLHGTVTEKNGKVRVVAFPIPVVLLMLDYVWNGREQILRRKGVSRAEAANWMWPSATTGGPLERKTISDLIARQGFSAAGVRGSGHSLRAAFMTETACRLIREAKARFGRNYDINSIELQLAEIAGHATTDSLKNYIKRARIAEAMSPYGSSVDVQPDFKVVSEESFVCPEQLNGNLD